MKTIVGSGPISGYNMQAARRLDRRQGAALLRRSHRRRPRLRLEQALRRRHRRSREDTELSLQDLPRADRSDLSYPRTYAAVDLALHRRHLPVATSRAVDQHGFASQPARPGRVARSLYANQWNAVGANRDVAAGKTIDRILVGYDNPKRRRHPLRRLDRRHRIVREPAAIDGSGLTDYVDTRRGTNSSGGFSRGNNLPVTRRPARLQLLHPGDRRGLESLGVPLPAGEQRGQPARAARARRLATSRARGWATARFPVMPSAGAGVAERRPRGRGAAFSHDERGRAGPTTTA